MDGETKQCGSYSIYAASKNDVTTVATRTRCRNLKQTDLLEHFRQK